MSTVEVFSKDRENGLGRYVKNNIESLLVAVRTSRTITKETVDGIAVTWKHQNLEEKIRLSDSYSWQPFNHFMFLFRVSVEYFEKNDCDLTLNCCLIHSMLIFC